MSMELPPVEELGAEIMARAEALGRLSEGGPGVTRRFATPQHRAAVELIQGWMRAAGMHAALDASGNVVGRYEGGKPGLPALMMGSHQDTVKCGGRYDGMLGIIAPISCVAALNKRGIRLPYAIEIVAFGDEEGLRFQTTFLGSRAVAGTFDKLVLARTDTDGVTVERAMRDFGLDPAEIPALARRKEQVLAFVEVHIEQGPVLEAKSLPVGVVTAIAGCTRLAVRLEGEAGHAGTVPMQGRRDALAGAAECALAVERLAAGRLGVLATVGQFAPEPGAINVIPGAVRFSVDARGAADPDRLALVADIEREIAAIAGRRRLGAAVDRTLDAKACACTPWVMDRIEAAVVAEGIAPFRLTSGAGHDAMAMAELTDVGMLFVRCERGISHNPAEAITARDAGIGARVLLRLMEDLRRP
jgi:allantoate deiminase